MHVPEGIGPRNSSAPTVHFNRKDAMEVRNSGDILGAIGHGACAESSTRVAGKIGSDIFNDLLGKLGRG